MRSSRRIFLQGIGAAAGAAALGDVAALTPPSAHAASKTQITFWCTPFVSGEDPPSFVKWFGQQQAKDLKSVTFSADYGPGAYDTQQHKFIIQARTGTPDTLEGLLENMVAYIRAGLITPLADRFNAWSDHGAFLARRPARSAERSASDAGPDSTLLTESASKAWLEANGIPLPRRELATSAASPRHGQAPSGSAASKQSSARDGGWLVRWVSSPSNSMHCTNAGSESS